MESSNGINLTELDNYALLGIFDNLEFSELLSVADVNANFRSLIAAHYMIAKHHINKKILLIKDNHPPFITAQVINIGQYDTIRTMLRNFGDLITSIEFATIHLSTMEVNVISHDIEKYCAKSLVQLKLTDVGIYLTGEVKQTFENIRNVILWQYDYVDNMELDRIYPMMEQLTFDVIYPIEMTSLIRFYPHLKHLEFNEFGSYAEDSVLLEVLQCNPQLRTLHLNRFLESNDLQVISENLVHLESLGLAIYPRSNNNDPSESQIVHFKNVNQFKITVEHVIIVDENQQIPITFGNLEAIEIFSTKLYEPLQKLIERNNNLKAISLPWTETMRSFLRIVNVFNRLSHLEEITVKWSNGINADDTLRLFNGNRSLMKITFIVSVQHCDDLLAVIPGEWEKDNIQVDYQVNYVTVIRIGA